MESVSLSADIAAPRDRVREVMLDLGAFMRAAGFDDVTVSDDRIEITNTVGLLSIELSLAVVDQPGAVLAYEQEDGIFEAMTTTYRLEESEGVPAVTATTEFALDVALVGPIFDATVVKRQRRRELSNQFEYLRAECE